MDPDVSEYISSLKNSPRFGPQVVFHKKIDGVPAKFSKKATDLSPTSREIMKKAGIKNIFSHQSRAIRYLLQGHDIIVATPTASGKSMIYNLPVLDELNQDIPGTSIYVFPLKALARDQLNTLESLAQLAGGGQNPKNGPIAALFDGDTSPYMRRKIRNDPPPVLLTNPEMLHLSILPYHDSWANFFARLRYIVIDEVHSYRGVLGSHMSWLLRRLQRIASWYGAEPVFVLLSATIGNPGELAELLLDRSVKVIEESGAPRSEKHFLMINPWDSAAYSASRLLEAAMKRGLRTIVYTQSRKMTELIAIWTSERLGQLADKLSAYRAGFLPEERRDIEQRLFSGRLLGVISTSALELGIDVGDLDLCILVGYPGSVMATWQRGGRVGRGGRSSAVILIAQEDALDQYLMRNPEDFFKRAPESAVLNPENDIISAQHLHCCSAELSLKRNEPLLQNSKIREKVVEMTIKGVLLETGSGGCWLSTRKYPQRLVSLRGGGRQLVIIELPGGEITGEIDSTRALKECHPGAVYIHRGMVQLVEHLDLEGGEVVVRRESPNYYTRPMVSKRTEILEVYGKKTCFGLTVSLGRVKVMEKVTGYQKKNKRTQRTMSTIDLDLPEQTIETEGIWFDVEQETRTYLEEKKLHFMGAIHAFEHGIIALFPLLVLCDHNDIGGISCPVHDQTEKGSIFVYDGHQGGVGLARAAYGRAEELLRETYKVIMTCGCENGCPSCVHSPKCGSGNRPIDKQACLEFFGHIFANPLDPENMINQEEKKANKTNSYPTGLNSLPKHFGVFDLETIRSAKEVGGWAHCEKMGISVAVIYDSRLDSYVSYLEEEIDDFIDHLHRLDLIVGFNNIRFDNRVISAYTDRDLTQLPNLDLLAEVQKYLGYRLSLDRLAATTLGRKKSADGLQALQWYREGKIELIARYCKDDVELTRDLLYYALENGYFLFKNKAGKEVRLPLALDRQIATILLR
ncbi:hypothetical protein DGMP_14900 [Desulfomarina profundi]|uniref:DEAD/DEAH box helicase n=1 Tax=Desulfomarina profundi TaxID=2772557 RepID=A0A8D5FVS0_9BACT|nr:DEAD/DEAH box helicase [Desulfomarina profundi]BCL60797.1 hypothetical protein DGMP_14900 [Desulfomarina profundi]